MSYLLEIIYKQYEVLTAPELTYSKQQIKVCMYILNK